MKMMRPKSYSSRGFTLIECIVVITVIGLIVALLLPAILAAREAMRRSHCANNLRQMGTALHSYGAQFGVFPGGNNGRGLSLHAALLPQIEQLVVYNSLNLATKSLPIIAEENRTTQDIRISAFICPSDYFDAQSISNNNNYAGNEGTSFDPRTLQHKQDGIFIREGVIDSASIQDGLSHTNGIAEWIRDQKTNEIRAIFKLGSDVSQLYRLCAQASSSNQNGYKAANWISGNFEYTLYNHVMGINQSACQLNGIPDLGAWTVGSHHNGGANVLKMDGHVSFVKESTNLNVWRSMGTRDGGEILNGGD